MISVPTKSCLTTAKIPRDKISKAELSLILKLAYFTSELRASVIELACIVVNTKCPEIEARRHSHAASGVLISPIKYSAAWSAMPISEDHASYHFGLQFVYRNRLSR